MYNLITDTENGVKMLPLENKKVTNLPGDREMEKYGIKHFPVDYFHYREFRYTNLKDAIAQAKRDETSHERASVS
jgi:hypothetical protein